jgi:diguanylate cyclase (GGDEF)-like protein/PAS domain S-box-containing protein
MTDHSEITATPSCDASPGPDSEIFRLAFRAAPTAMLVVAADGAVMVANDAAELLFGYQAGEMVGLSVDALVPAPVRGGHAAMREGFARQATTRPMGAQRDLWGVRKSGAEIPVEVGLSPFQTAEGTLVLCVVVDLTVRRRLEDALSHLAEERGKENRELLQLVRTDPLTSLKNRRGFLESLATQLEVSIRHARPLSLLILDVDHFKPYNDEFGHLAGDQVLRRVGEILHHVARRSDVVARVGGEEFGIILPETDASGAVALAERFRAAIEAVPWPLRPITASLGAMTADFGRAVPRPEAPALSALLEEADQALYRSKEEGRNRVTHASDPAPPAS